MYSRALICLFLVVIGAVPAPALADCADLRNFTEVPRAELETFVGENDQAVLDQLKNSKASPSRRFAVANILAAKKPKLILKNLNSLNLSTAQRREIVIQIAARTPELLQGHIAPMKLDKAARIAILNEVVNGVVRGIEDRQHNFLHDKHFSVLAELQLQDSEVFPYLRRFGLGYLENHILTTGIRESGRWQLFSELYKSRDSAVENLKKWGLSSAHKIEVLTNNIHSSWNDDPAYIYYEADVSPQEVRQALKKFRRNPENIFGNHKNLSFVAKFIRPLKLSERERAEILTDFLSRAKPYNWYLFRDNNRDPFLADISFTDPKLNLAIAKAALQNPSVHDDATTIGISDFSDFIASAKFPKGEAANVVNMVIDRGAFDSDSNGPGSIAIILRSKHLSNEDKIRILGALTERENFENFTSAQVTSIFASLGPKYQGHATTLLAGLGAPVETIVDQVRVNPRQRLEILEELARRDANKFFAFLTEHNIGPKDRRVLAQKIFAWHPDFIDKHILRLNLSESDRFELARRRIDQDEVKITDMGGYGLRNPEYQFEIAKASVRKDPTHEAIENARSQYLLKDEQVEALRRLPFALDPLGAMKSDSFVFREDMPLDEIRGALTQHAIRHPNLLPEAWVPVLWDRVKKRQSGLDILKLIYDQRDYNITGAPPKSSIDVVAQALGYKAQDLHAAQLSPDRLGAIYELSLDLKRNIKAAPFEGIQIEAQLFKKDALQGFLSRLRDATHLFGNRDAALAEVKSKLKLSEGLKVASIEGLTKDLEKIIVGKIQEIFGAHELKIGYEELTKLQSEWGDLEPIFTLVSRYSGGHGWRGEVPVMAKIFKSALEGKFKEYKFQGDPTNADDIGHAQRQLAILDTPEKKAAWQQSRSRVSLFAPGGAGVSDLDRLTGSREVIRTNLVPHLGLGSATNPAVLSAVQEVISTYRDPAVALQVLRNDKLKDMEERDFNHSLLLAGIKELRNTTDIERARQLSINLLVWSKKMDLSADVTADLRDINQRLKPAAVETKDAVVVTTTFADAKTLITVGDLVKCASCQNYRTGGLIGTLPGYVVDANVQGLASFHLEQSKFKNTADFAMVKQALKTGIKIDVDYNGGQRTVAFKFRLDNQDWHIETQGLDQAYLRHIVKLNTGSSGRPDIFFERGYSNSIDSLPLMATHAREIQREMAQAVDGTVDQAKDFVGSRNPGGVYSDAAGGQMLGNYQLRQ